MLLGGYNEGGTQPHYVTMLYGILPLDTDAPFLIMATKIRTQDASPLQPGFFLRCEGSERPFQAFPHLAAQGRGPCQSVAGQRRLIAAHFSSTQNQRPYCWAFWHIRTHSITLPPPPTPAHCSCISFISSTRVPSQRRILLGGVGPFARGECDASQSLAEMS